MRQPAQVQIRKICLAANVSQSYEIFLLGS